MRGAPPPLFFGLNTIGKTELYFCISVSITHMPQHVGHSTPLTSHLANNVSLCGARHFCKPSLVIFNTDLLLIIPSKSERK